MSKVNTEDSDLDQTSENMEIEIIPIFTIMHLIGRRNCITIIFDENALKYMQWEAISKVAMDFFSKLFTCNNLQVNFEQLFGNVKIKALNDHEKEWLSWSFVEKEIVAALKSMHPITKALGLDGIHNTFYQENWEIVSSVLTNVILDCLN